MPQLRALRTASCFAVLASTLIRPLPAQTAQEMTPLLLAVSTAPVPFTGSDARQHLVYELSMTNFSSGDAVLEQVEVIGDGTVLQTLDAAAIAKRLQPAGQRIAVDSLPRSAAALLFVHVTLPAGAAAPQQLTHRVRARFSAAPPGRQVITETGGDCKTNTLSIARIGPPLRGGGYISADSCCDATRHTRAAMPIDGVVYVAQRYAVDWEQMDSTHRIYSGPREQLASYTIFGKPVLAVADATVAVVTRGLPEQVPGRYPEHISPAQADGNAIILDLGDHRFALYAHLQSESIRVNRGDHVRRGDAIALVGNSGNSVAPHLHFHVMTTELALASEGLPYEIDSFEITATSPGTAAFDAAEADGTPLSVTPVVPPRTVSEALPLDQQIISFATR